MKYSLRSLMTFSIRDLALVTVIVAILVAWWLDRSRLAALLHEAQGAERVLDTLWPNWRERYGTDTQ